MQIEDVRGLNQPPEDLPDIWVDYIDVLPGEGAEVTLKVKLNYADPFSITVRLNHEQPEANIGKIIEGAYVELRKDLTALINHKIPTILEGSNR